MLGWTKREQNYKCKHETFQSLQIPGGDLTNMSIFIDSPYCQNLMIRSEGGQMYFSHNVLKAKRYFQIVTSIIFIILYLVTLLFN